MFAPAPGGATTPCLSAGLVRGHGDRVREKKPSARTFSLRFLRVGVFLQTFLSLCFLALSAVAEQKSGARELEAIRRRMEAGLALFVGSKYSDAAREFDAGYADHPYSAFLFNAGVCYQKLGEKQTALDRYHEYLRIDPNAPDAETVKRRIASIEAELPAAAPTPQAPDTTPPPAPEAIPATEDAMRSLVVVETEPPGAPVKVYAALREGAAAWSAGAANAEWKEAATGSSPTNFSLPVGRFHIVVEKFQDFNVSETDLKVSAGHVYHFKANLSQGAFMSFLRVSSNFVGAHVWLDDPKKQRPEWGNTPYGELVAAGDHEVLVEAPGFQPLHTNIRLEHGEQKELEVRLVRVDYGILRVDSNADDAKVQIDSEPRGIWRKGEAPLDVEVPAGQHRLTIEGTDRKTYEGMIDVPRGEVVRVHAKLWEKIGRGAAWVETVVATLCVGTGVFLGLESNQLYRQAEADRQAHVLDDQDGRITKGTAFSIGADVAFVAGAGFAALATYSFLEDPMPDSTSTFEKGVDFDDPAKDKPKSASRAARDRVARQRLRARGTSLRVSAAPTTFGIGGALRLGGSF
jgi:PEGA domain